MLSSHKGLALGLWHDSVKKKKSSYLAKYLHVNVNILQSLTEGMKESLY